MDAHDLFKKLTAGVCFDKKKFGDDINKFQAKKNLSNVSTVVNETSSSESDGEIRSKEDVKDCASDDNSADKTESLTNKKSCKSDSKNELKFFRRELRIHVKGSDIAKPIREFSDLKVRYNFPKKVLDKVVEYGYAAPTPIQMQAIPVMLQRREILACAPTGSGKTAAFLLPVIKHLNRPKNCGVRAVIVAPTRELAEQIFRECNHLCKVVALRPILVSKVNEVKKKLSSESGLKVDILITTPNRLVYMLKEEPPILSLGSVEWLVVDESDKLFEAGATGFRDQLAVIYNACDSRKIRRAMFSATVAEEVEQWCRDCLDDLVTVYVGSRNATTRDVRQELVYVGDEAGKLVAFRNLVKSGLRPPVLIFVQTKERAKELFDELIYDGIHVDAIHSERSLLQRDNSVKAFRSGKIWVLICTDLLGRGMDFKGVNLVVNYDFPPSTISYIHRIGRTGRAGRTGSALTYYTRDDFVNLRSIAQVVKDSGCDVPAHLLTLKKATRNEKKRLARKAPTRKSISTESKYDLEKKRKLEVIIEKSKKKKMYKSNKK